MDISITKTSDYHHTAANESVQGEQIGSEMPLLATPDTFPVSAIVPIAQPDVKAPYRLTILENTTLHSILPKNGSSTQDEKPVTIAETKTEKYIPTQRSMSIIGSGIVVNRNYVRPVGPVSRSMDARFFATMPSFLESHNIENIQTTENPGDKKTGADSKEIYCNNMPGIELSFQSIVLDINDTVSCEKNLYMETDADSLVRTMCTIKKLSHRVNDIDKYTAAWLQLNPVLWARNNTCNALWQRRHNCTINKPRLYRKVMFKEHAHTESQFFVRVANIITNWNVRTHFLIIYNKTYKPYSFFTLL
ncbi:unnamed protein product [Orchesella dallaii]|uniref:Uncharacterized protein n=1 Tax=Orchesella dallaii TaxID=48710 RepID=A0ABP1Q698_9HEXA